MRFLRIDGANGNFVAALARVAQPAGLQALSVAHCLQLQDQHLDTILRAHANLQVSSQRGSTCCEADRGVHPAMLSLQAMSSSWFLSRQSAVH